MNSSKYGFIVLNYMAYKETINCIKSIISLYSEYDYYIVIVDNDSKNESYTILKQLYGDNERIDVTKNTANEGYAKGNNFGYIQLKEKYNPDYIIVANSDIVFKQNSFLDLINTKYEKYSFDILGPDIIFKKNSIIYHQNPHKIKLETIDYLKNKIKENEKIITKLENDILYRFIYRIELLIIKIKQYLFSNSNKKHYYDDDILNCIVSGALMVFSKRYFENKECLFCPETFLYSEEKILFFEISKNNGLMMYSPDLQVVHNHGGGMSTEFISSSVIEKELKKRKMSLNSKKVLLKLMEENKENE